MDKKGNEFMLSFTITQLGLVMIFSKVQDDGKYKIIDWQNRVVQLAIFEEIEGIYAGMIKVKMEGKYGFLNQNGKLILPTVYHSVNNSN